MRALSCLVSFLFCSVLCTCFYSTCCSFLFFLIFWSAVYVVGRLMVYLAVACWSGVEARLWEGSTP